MKFIWNTPLKDKILLNLLEQDAITGWKTLPDSMTGENDVLRNKYLKLQNKARDEGIPVIKMKGFNRLLKRWNKMREQVEKHNVATVYLKDKGHLELRTELSAVKFNRYGCKLLEKGVKEAELIQVKKREIINKWLMITLTAIIAISTIVNVWIEVLRYNRFIR